MRAAIRNEAIAATAFAVVRNKRSTVDQRGIENRSFTSGSVSVQLSILPASMGGSVLLDVWMSGIGKVAGFRLTPDFSEVETVSIKAKTLPQWLPILEFEAKHAGQT